MYLFTKISWAIICCIFICLGTTSSVAQQVKTEMRVHRSVDTPNPTKVAIIAKVGNDEARIKQAMDKVRQAQAAGKRVMTNKEFKEWKRQVNAKLRSLKTDEDKKKMKAFIARKTAKIVVLEQII